MLSRLGREELTESHSFTAAEQLNSNFKLFFSFDMAVLDQPSTFLPLFRQYQGSSAYYRHDGRPFVSTFNGGAKSFGAAAGGASGNGECLLVPFGSGSTRELELEARAAGVGVAGAA